ncbi:MAG: multifunctional CCA tRNA nucleotidyl transferase/2'3'-cyclic phosphodiesterase/2'nucleotidase/phosphatase [Alphaproteobacteria bacterium]|nr:multifunctional CCA tRNA nucleotidyl transferase/2'3'-cyclic phosphodiesterase/2'nucleotidase/phosphatase [Alphaproteobacteria bacterium]
MQIYKVGGAVRDKLLHKTSQDNDYVVVGSTIEEMLSLGYTKVGKSFPVFLHPITKEEYALARKEIKKGSRHQDFEFIFTPSITLEEDAIRRDFTCNAIYEDTATGELIDFHHGIEDIKNKVLRHISPHFKEDPLRVLRACRFVATLNFSLAPETISICQKMVEEGAIQHLSKARIFQELEKALSSPYFYRFVETARQIGLLQELFPEVEKLWSIPEREDYHPEKNTGTHTLLALKSANSKDAVVNFSILLHDIGKTKTDQTLWPSHHFHENLGIDLAKNILKRIDAPKIYQEFIPFAIQNHMISHSQKLNNPKNLAKVALFLAKHQKQNYYLRFIDVLRADIKGRAIKDLNNEDKEFQTFISMFERYYNASLKSKNNLIEDFPSVLEKLKNKQITNDELNEIVEKAIIKEANFT